MLAATLGNESGLVFRVCVWGGGKAIGFSPTSSTLLSLCVYLDSLGLIYRSYPQAMKEYPSYSLSDGEKNQ